MTHSSIYRLPGQQQPGRQILFQNALLEVYQESNGLFGFTYYCDRAGYWDTFNGSPIYLSAQAALRQAKLHAVKETVSQATNYKLLVDLSSDKIIHHSPMVEEILGVVTGYQCADLYVVPSDRAKIRKTLQDPAAKHEIKLQTLDGTAFDCVIEAEVIPLDCVQLGIETITLDAVPRSP